MADNLNIQQQGCPFMKRSPAPSPPTGERLEWHYTPKHGSLARYAESELGVLGSQCLDSRSPDKQTLIDEAKPGSTNRNAKHTKATDFTTQTPVSKSNDHNRPSN